MPVLTKIKPLFSFLKCSFFVFAIINAGCRPGKDETKSILYLHEAAPISFAANKLKESLELNEYNIQIINTLNSNNINGESILFLLIDELALHPDLKARLTLDISGIMEEGFIIESVRQDDRLQFLVIAADDGGLMYGGLELSEQIALYGWEGVKPVQINPHMSMRGTKFNIPLDARTPSYSDLSDSGQRNMEEMWELDFWKSYLDLLASYRYNFVSLWSLHPFPSMVKVPDYPDVALDDVMQSTTQWQEYYSTQGTGFDDPSILDHLQTIKKISIDEKVVFWNQVMQYAADRNIKFYVVTWNIFDYGTQGKYGITADINNPTTVDYFRKSVAAMFNSYPLLAGIGLTTGENMPGASFLEKEEWAFKTYGQGILDASRENPQRRFTFIHRQHQTGAQDIARQFKEVFENENIDFIFSFKYAQAHVYSSTKQHFHTNFVEDIGNIKTIWTLRNDDVYQFRWGAPDFVREFIKYIPHDVSQGYYFGSDQYIWGREFLSQSPSTPRQMELSKHWFQWLLWGRLGFDPDITNDRFIDILAHRYPEISAPELLKAWQHASMIYPITTGFHWGEFDFQWYIEACKSRPGPAQTTSGFHDVNRFITLPPHESTDYMSIPDFVRTTMENKTIRGTTPWEVAELLHDHADNALEIVGQFENLRQEELNRTINDIKAMANLGKYYAFKIQGATALALFRKTGNLTSQQEAVRALESASDVWKQYIGIARQQYINPFWTNRVGHIDWGQLTLEVEKDIAIASAPL